MSDDIVENLKQPSQWLRIGFMLALAIALYVASVILTLLTLAQAVFSLLTGSDNVNLRALGRDLATYVKQILDFLTYNSENKPFPFSDYPNGDVHPANEEPEPNPEPVAPEPAPAAAKPARKPRKPAAKKPAKPKAKAKAKTKASPAESETADEGLEASDKPQE